MQDVADFTSSLIKWAGDHLPQLKVRAVGTRDIPPHDLDTVLVRLASVEGSNGPRTGDAISRRLTLEYEFDLKSLEPPSSHQALADLTFALLERPDLADGRSIIRGEESSVRASFTIVRATELLRAKPVGEAVVDVRASVQVPGRVQSERGVPIPKARIRVAETGRLLIADNGGHFEFTAPAGLKVSAIVSAKGREARVELTPGQPNIVTLSMEA